MLMNRFKVKKGVTLLELIITLGLLGMITALVFFFFGSNQKTLRIIGVKSNLQYEAKVVMDSISKYAMEAASAKAEPYTGETENISFNLLSHEGDKILDGAVFSKEGSNLTVTLTNELGESNSRVLSEYVESIKAVVNQVEDSISIDLTLTNKGVSYSVKENYLFRNSHVK